MTQPGTRNPEPGTETETDRPFRLSLPAWAHREMLEHCVAESPREAVGYLAGRDGVVTVRLPLVNALASATEFVGEPRSTLDAHKRMRERGVELLAVYHSHPTSAPTPSAKDFAGNPYGDAVMCVIVGLAGEKPEVRGWWLGTPPGVEAEIVVEPPELG